MDSDERALLDRGVRHALADASGDGSLVALGWHDVLRAESRTAVSVVFGAQGDLNASTSSLDDVMFHGFGVPRSLGETLTLPAFDEWSPPGTYDGDVLAVEGLAMPRAAHGDAVVVPARAGAQVVLATVAVDTLTNRAVHGLDPDLGLRRIHGTGLRPLRTDPLDHEAWDAGLAAGRRALATELVAAGRAMVRLACEHARDREQFGHPVAGFQAVRHRLADAHVALEGADAAVTAAWDAPGPLTALLAKSLAGRAARVATTHCQQVLAGIGFTTEHPLHRYVRRAAVLDGLLGSSFRLPRHLGATMLAARHAPRLVEL
jgi:hypothetical protein